MNDLILSNLSAYLIILIFNAKLSTYSETAKTVLPEFTF